MLARGSLQLPNSSFKGYILYSVEAVYLFTVGKEQPSVYGLQQSQKYEVMAYMQVS